MAQLPASLMATAKNQGNQVQKSRRIPIFLLIASLSAILLPNAVGAPLTTPTAVCNTDCKIDFPYTAANYYQWSVPRSDTYTVELWGAQGGGGANFYGAGGAGGYVRGNIYLTSGTILYIYPGQAGVRYNSGSTTAFNGGGAGNPTDGYSGGGASHIATSVGLLSSRASDTSSVLAVAGSGGGGAGSSSNYGAGYSPAGGVGGGATGGSPVDSTAASIRGKGLGGTQIAGGATGLANETGYDLPAVASGFGVGASVNAYTADGIQGGGGGAGWYGGGAGSHRGGAGGGGSSYVSRLSSVTNLAGNSTIVNPDGTSTTGRLGSGHIRIAYTAPVPIALQSFSLSGAVLKGSPVAITATINTPGKITFLANGKRIPGCIGKSAPVSAPYSVVCNWKPNARGNLEISFFMVPADSSLSSAASSGGRISVANRSGRR
jgi:hypothetical protein